MRVFAFHLLNDYSGSPKVLMQLLKGWAANDVDVTVITSKGRKGFLSDIPGVKQEFFWYRFMRNPMLRLIFLSTSQLLLLFKFFSQVNKQDVIYVNTVLPFAAGILGKLKGCRVIYHIHETTMKPRILKQFLFGIARLTASDIVYVSDYLAQNEGIHDKNTHILYNAIETEFSEKANSKGNSKSLNRTVLMVCSLKAYKGIREFITLASLRPMNTFKMVVNADQSQIDAFAQTIEIPSNVTIYPTQTNLHPFYQEADVILNLSRVDGWIETFGLTIIEGMVYGLPAIVPPIGGITELIEPGKNGYYADSRDIDSLVEKLDKIIEDRDNYKLMRKHSLHKIAQYSEETFISKSLQILQQAS